MMPTPDKAYWRGRFVQLEQSSHKDAMETMGDIDRFFRGAVRELDGDISRWYQRFANNNGVVSMAEARRLLNSAELKEFKWTVQDYIKHGKENGISADWRKELENASARWHISRLESLKIQLQNTCEVLHGNQLDSLDKLVSQTYSTSFFQTAFQVQTGIGVGWDITGLNLNAIQAAIRKPWSLDGRNFSDRIWANKEALIQELHKALTQNMMRGGNLNDVINRIEKTMGVSHSNARRLVLTENAYIRSVAQGDSYKATGVKQVVFVATLDDRTSDICRQMDGTVIDMKDYQPGMTVPPLHPYCRSTTAPHYADMAGLGERAARDPDTGKTYHVPRNMTYSDWEKTFINGGSKANLPPITAISTRAYTTAIASTLGKNHYDAMRDIMDNCTNADARAVWSKYEAGIGVADIHEQQRQCCDWDAQIHINLANDAQGNSWSKPYQTVFHESGHAIDMIAGRNAAGAIRCHPGNLYSATYQGGLFPRTIKSEVDALIVARDKLMSAEFNAHATDYDWLHQHNYINTFDYTYYKMYGTWFAGTPTYTMDMVYSAIAKEIQALPPFAKANISDIMEGATMEKIKAGWGHENTYWTQGDWTIATEAFAEMFDSTVSNSESLAAIQKYLPQSYQVFTAMLKDLK